ncbi:hypothetical protein SCHPADRAFT_939677 [Schizopora paradoxa]|uniref:Uncharacterized protein n=1 Tax=Schizopora paradoxa TaxID=27342 RepID=A0A0H2RQW0_9AGAM|nr:hypothetical protein SCHPADRAFT_939677 [Schizopora paradoxa]
MSFQSLLLEYFCCCHRRRPKESEGIPDEEVPFINPGDGAPPIVTYGVVSIDDGRAKERQNVIVRSKEGRMVNVLSRVPFNLRNEPGRASSSRSHRSTSATLDGPVNASTIGDAHRDLLEISRTSSPTKRSPPLSRTESMSSLQHGTLSRVSTSDELYDREPSLKVILIKTSKSHARALSRRGRSRTRSGRYIENGDVEDGAPTLEGIQSVDSGRAIFHVGDTSVNTDDEIPATADTDAAAQPDKVNVDALNDEDDAAIRALSEEISTSLSEDFKFQDVGSIARGWGD